MPLPATTFTPVPATSAVTPATTSVIYYAQPLTSVKPPSFSGSTAKEREEVDDWIFALRSALFRAPESNDPIKSVNWLSQHLHGSAAQWYASCYRSAYGAEMATAVQENRPARHMIPFASPDDFFEALRRHFGPHDPKAAYFDRYSALTQPHSQGKSNVAEHLANFSNALTLAEVDAEAPRTFQDLKRSFNKALQADLARVHPQSKTLEELKDVVTNLEKMQHETGIIIAARVSSNPGLSTPSPKVYSSGPVRTPAGAYTHPRDNMGVAPMQVDSTRRGPLSATEKERRKAQGLCAYCGEGQHAANDIDCPLLKARKARLSGMSKK